VNADFRERELIKFATLAAALFVEASLGPKSRAALQRAFFVGLVASFVPRGHLEEGHPIQD
jgi:hypothetical protein